MNDLLILILSLFVGLIIAAQVFSRDTFIPIYIRLFGIMNISSRSGPWGFWIAIITEAGLLALIVNSVSFKNIDFSDPMVVSICSVLFFFVWLPLYILIIIPYRKRKENKVNEKKSAA
jgi:hypothetical protein